MRDPNSEIWSLWDEVRKLPDDERKRFVVILDAFRKAG
jgi:hypothetical protein